MADEHLIMVLHLLRWTRGEGNITEQQAVKNDHRKQRFVNLELSSELGVSAARDSHVRVASLSHSVQLTSFRFTIACLANKEKVAY